jgi:23S rRNA-/tRNA-specific pseudouridylate synthase
MDDRLQALAPLGIGVLYADEVIAVLDKPHGLPSQAGRDGEPGVIEHLWAAGFQGAALHHRLDRPASGALAVALDPRANDGLAHAFRNRAASRLYLAVLGAPVEDTRWDAPLDGREARSDVRRIATRSGWSAVEVALHTGRTHQIRRHAALAGAPIIGDRRYGGEVGQAWPRLALHAHRLTLPHPLGGPDIAVACPLPADLQPVWALAGGAP